MSKINDLKDKQFSYLTVLNRADDKFTSKGKRLIMWECKCVCGNIKIVTSGKLTSGHVKSCGKCDIFSKIKDLTGMRFDKLLVLKMDGYYQYPNSKERDYKWLCLCDCGRYITLRGNVLKAKGNHNCGCYKNNIRLTDSDMIGKTFGNLKVVDRSDFKYSKSGHKIHRWLCECNCGSSLTVTGVKLRDGRAYACTNCLSKSKYELMVFDYLKLNDYDFKREVTFPDLIGTNGGFLRYDFFVKINSKCYIIECHGGQHYKPVGFFGGVDYYEKLLNHDAIKRDYAKSNDYNYIEIDCRKMTNKKMKTILDDFLK